MNFTTKKKIPSVSLRNHEKLARLFKHRGRAHRRWRLSGVGAVNGTSHSAAQDRGQDGDEVGQEHSDCAEGAQLSHILDELGVLVEPFPHHIPDLLEVVGEFAAFDGLESLERERITIF